MFILKYKSIFIGLAVLLVGVSFILMQKYGIREGIDFTGGTVMEIKYTTTNENGGSPPLTEEEILELRESNIEAFRTDTGNNFFEYKFISTDPQEKIEPIIREVIMDDIGYRDYMVTGLSEVGPTLGKEMTRKAIIAIIFVVLAILAFIAFSFREVSRPVSSWKYGVIAMVTLLHDIIVPTGVYVLLSYFYGAEVDTLFVIALLTILGISIADKIVVFDRIRENLKVHGNKHFDEVVGMSLRQTFTRSINTSVTVVLALVALYLYGPVATKFFALTLMVGMVVGTYSSIFVASPLLTVWNNWGRK